MTTPVSPLWPTRHDLPETVRRPMIDLLNARLADLIDLGLQAKQAHWNVKGPHFASLHALFDQVADQVEEAADEVAERAVELGGLARGTLAEVTRGTRLPAYPADLLAGPAHVAALAAALTVAAAATRAGIEAATAAVDASTADVLTEVSRLLDKQRWQVEAHAVGA